MKHLRTIKKASEEIGILTSFLRKLIRDGSLTKYKIYSAVYISLVEFESLAQPAEQPPKKV